MSKSITLKNEDYSRWYTDIITKAELADYGPVKGTMVIRPYGFSIWENVKSEFDDQFKKTGHINAYFPLFIPKSFFAKEAQHIEGFAKECAVVTHSRLKTDSKSGKLEVDPESRLDEEVIVRPTSETIIWSMYKKWINSYRDLPILINQWANVVRWEMRTRLFLRTSEFLWQEGHTAHATESEAKEEALKILNIYKYVVENVLAIPVITGTKSDSEKFAGAVETYSIEAMMGDKRALQAGTSHYLGQNFAKAFNVKFQNEDNNEQFVYATSWGVSTRLIGALIMVHGDNIGLRLPPKIAPIQIVFIPIINKNTNLENILKYLKNLFVKLDKKNIRYHIDKREKVSPGFKFNEWEMKGIPIRVEIGSKDICESKLFICRRDNQEKSSISIKTADKELIKLLELIQNNLYKQALLFQSQNTYTINDYLEFKKIIKLGGFVKCGWDGTEKSELSIKKETKATIRCIPFNQNLKNLKCIFSELPAKYEVIFSKAY
tara:strand:- start:667 stop:2139 length:1473 start_codon:yes stop_codon:yes gene_type:complete